MTKSGMGSVVALSVSVAAITTIASEQPAVPQGWRRLRQPPAMDSPENRCAGRTPTNWVVAYSDSAITITQVERLTRMRDPLPYEIDFAGVIDDPPPPSPAPDGTPSRPREGWARDYARDHAGRRVVQVEDGWLVGFDGGEYGGSLWWYPPQRGAGTKLSSHNVRAIEPGEESGTYVVLSGLDHMGARQGAVLRVAREDGTWGVRSSVNLDGQVWAHAAHPDGWVAVTQTNVILISKRGTVRRVATLPETYATPISVAVGPIGDIAIGRRFFVSVLRRQSDSYQEEWFIPPACQRFEDGPFLCECRGGA